MSGHSKWSTIKRKKGANDAKRGAVFTRLAKELTIAAREGGGDPNANFSLRLKIDKARAENMPKDNIDRAIKRGTGELKDGAELEQILYEGYAGNGIALMIECITDNRNRTVAELRHALKMAGGSLGENGSVAWQFTRIAYFSFPADGHDVDDIFEMAVEAGADDVNFEDDVIEITGPMENFKSINDALEAKSIQPSEAEIQYQPTQETELDPEKTVSVLESLERVEELDDVQNVVSNLKITDEAMAMMSGD
jgi:YebC/PmpR family DNA-binding regulatory protein